jgi:septal ring factor EnvC (AmiA/AmiB activator)
VAARQQPAERCADAAAYKETRRSVKATQSEVDATEEKLREKAAASQRVQKQLSATQERLGALQQQQQQKTESVHEAVAAAEKGRLLLQHEVASEEMLALQTEEAVREMQAKVRNYMASGAAALLHFRDQKGSRSSVMRLPFSQQPNRMNVGFAWCSCLSCKRRT